MISVIVRSFNDEKIIAQTLTMLSRQRCSQELEILNFDSNSTDLTLEIVKQFNNVKIIPPEPGVKYNPAQVLNRAVTYASGDIIVFNNSDALPLSDDYIAELIAPLENPEVGAVFAQQLPRKEAWPLVQKDYARAFGDGRIASTWRHMFSMASSAARKEIFDQVKFDPRYQYSEDIEWSWRLKTVFGFKIIYVPSAQVEHSHNYTYAEMKKRFYNEGIANSMIWPQKTSFLKTILAMFKEMLRDVIYLFDNHKFNYLFCGLKYRFIQRVYTYRGEKDYLRGQK